MLAFVVHFLCFVSLGKQRNEDEKIALYLLKFLYMSTENKGFGIARENYKFFVAGIALIVLGYLLMMGGGSEDPNIFNPEIFSFRRITLAPLVCLAGFATVMVAIMR